MTKCELIQKMRYARKIHIGWGNFQKKNKNKVDRVGGWVWHFKWAKIYEEVIKRLENKK